MVSKVTNSEFAGRYERTFPRFIGRVSFESRSAVVPSLLKNLRTEGSVVFASKDRSALAERNLEAIKSVFPELPVAEVDISDPISLADKIFGSVKKAVDQDGLMNTVVDVSSFRREELLILLAALNSLDVPGAASCELVYVRAGEMDRDWLSRNVVCHRSVVGFAGDIWPSRKTKLVLLIGFEIDRAQSIIEHYEPAEVIIGVSSVDESMNEEFNKRNRLFHEDLLRQFAGKCSQFEFSARDPLRTARELQNVLSSDIETNIIIAPLNTKLSTLGAGVYALRNKEVQICYSEMDEYNEETYSVPSPDIYSITLSDLLSDRQDP